MEKKFARNILFIEDDAEFAQAFSEVIEDHTHSRVTMVSDPYEAVMLISDNAFDLVITDWNLPALNGFSLLKKADKAISSDPQSSDYWFSHRTPVIVLTGGDIDEIDTSKRPHGMFHFLGAVSKRQMPIDILAEIEGIYANDSLAIAI
jgi:CheY-like chemotaxis protein